MSENNNEFLSTVTEVEVEALDLQTIVKKKPAKAKKSSSTQDHIAGSVNQVRSRDDLLTDFGKKTLVDRYLLPEESYQDMFSRVSEAYADDVAHAQRLYDYMSKLWFMPATPVLSNGGADRGLPISCFLNAVDDSLDSIVDAWTENVWLASNGGGIGTLLGQCALYWRENWPRRQNLGHHSFYPRDGQLNTRHFSRIAAPRLSRCLSGYPPSRNRRILRNSQALWRL